MGLNICAGVTSLKCPRWITGVLRGLLINCEAVASNLLLLRFSENKGKPVPKTACTNPIRTCISSTLEVATPTRVCGRKI